MDGVGYTNRISLNCNPRGEEDQFVSKFQHRGFGTMSNVSKGLTTISEESNINIVDAVERSSVRSGKSEN